MRIRFDTQILFRLMLLVLIGAVSYLAFTPNVPDVATHSSDKTNHVIAFLVLSFVVDAAFKTKPYIIPKVVTLLFYGLFVELIQGVLAYRSAELMDWFVDGAAVLGYFIIRPVLLKLSVFRMFLSPLKKAT